MELKELNKRIDDVNASAVGLQGKYTEVGLLVLEHVGKHGDVGPANRLYLGMPKSIRRLAMGQWLVKYGKMKPNADRPTMQTMPLVFDKSKETDMEGAKAKNWWEMAPEREITDVIDLQVAIRSLLNRCKDKTIKVGGKPMSSEAAQSALRTMSLMVGLPVDPVTVDDSGKMHLGQSGQVGDITPVEPAKVDAAVSAAATAAQKAVEAAAKGSTKKPGMEQGEKETATARKAGTGKARARTTETAGRAKA